jgi:(3S)-malyl-CoA thioesterase
MSENGAEATENYEGHIMDTRPFRSVLYIPALERTRAGKSGNSLATDAIIFDLEDAVAIDEKARARTLLAARLQDPGLSDRAPNWCGSTRWKPSEWGADDLDVIAQRRVPKRSCCPRSMMPARSKRWRNCWMRALRRKDTRIWAMMESPLGVLNAAGDCARAAHGGLCAWARMIWPRT